MIESTPMNFMKIPRVGKTVGRKRHSGINKRSIKIICDIWS
jgi:hypothetical protein